MGKETAPYPFQNFGFYSFFPKFAQKSWKRPPTQKRAAGHRGQTISKSRAQPPVWGVGGLNDFIGSGPLSGPEIPGSRNPENCNFFKPPKNLHHFVVRRFYRLWYFLERVSTTQNPGFSPFFRFSSLGPEFFEKKKIFWKFPFSENSTFSIP